MKTLPSDAIAPEHLARLTEQENRAKAAEQAGGGNLLAYIADNAESEIQSLLAERVKLVSRVHEVNERIAALQTHALVTPKETP